MYDFSGYTEQVNAMLANVDDDIARIDGVIIAKAKEYIKPLITAPSDAEFAKLQEQFLEEIKALGHDEAMFYWFSNYKAVCDELGLSHYYKNVDFPEGIE
ncbi:MAG: hypothetical protein GX633_04825 [Clostridiales bacterium]|jgi:predicted amino acid-binding ACT domain protein|nr:hypothetical protein [Clostridiales bacterium]